MTAPPLGASSLPGLCTPRSKGRGNPCRERTRPSHGTEGRGRDGVGVGRAPGFLRSPKEPPALTFTDVPANLWRQRPEWVSFYPVLGCLGFFPFISVVKSCPTLCNPMDCSTPVFPVHHQLPEFTQTHVHWVGDAIQKCAPIQSFTFFFLLISTQNP